MALHSPLFIWYVKRDDPKSLSTGSDREEQQGRFKAVCGHRDGPERAALADRSGDGRAEDIRGEHLNRSVSIRFDSIGRISEPTRDRAPKLQAPSLK
jgi:hypothetical protein